MALDAACTVHGAQLILSNSTIVQVLGIPAPPGLVPVIPKYRPCRGPSPWRGVSGAYCRITRKYGPLGVEAGIGASGLRERWDPLYGAPMPYVEDAEVSVCVEPRRALLHAIAAGEPVVTRVVDYLRSRGVSTTCLGLTGSRALGIAHEESDVDLVVYDCVEEVFELFESLSSDWGRPELGGVRAHPLTSASWRRARIENINTTWVPARNLCPPLSSYWRIEPPDSKTRLILEVEPRQPWSLGYPACAVSKSGVWIVSYEYNLAGILYRGGVMEVEGVASRDGKIVYLGLREEPGTLLCSCANA